MTSKKTVGLLAGLLLLLLVLAAGLLSRRPGASAPTAASLPTPAARARARVPAIVVPVGEVVRDGSPAGSVEGVVVSALDGAGVPGAELTFALGGATLSATTDGQGAFRFAPADSGSYQLARVSAEAHQPFSPEADDSPIAFALRAGERIRGVRLALRPLRLCQGRVVDPAGQPVTGARVLAYGAGHRSPPPAATTDQRGHFEIRRLDSGTVEARHGELLAREDLNLPPLAPCQLRLQLAPAPSSTAVAIVGRVERDDGQPMGAVWVEAWANPVLEREANRRFAGTMTGEDGRFQLQPLDPVRYEVQASGAAGSLARAHDVRGGTGDLVLRVPTGGRLRGQVKDRASGAPVASFSVVLSRRELYRGIRPDRVFTRYDARGVFEIVDVPAGVYRAVALADGRAPDEQAVEIAPDPAPAAEVSFALAAGGRLHGRVSDRSNGQALPGAWVSLEGRASLADSLPLRAQTVTGADGRFELRGLADGPLSLVVSASRHDGRLVADLHMKDGREVGPVLVDLAPVPDGHKPRLEFSGIGAVLAPDGDVLVLGKLSPDGGAARAGLQPGDAIVAIDGRPVARMDGLGEAVGLIRGPEGTSVLLRIRRGADKQLVDVIVQRRLIRGP
jgi:protocatechuate 3,4-dioxygenase beta subunit